MQLGQKPCVLQQMFDFDRDVVGERRIPAMEPLEDSHRVRGTVEEVGIAKRHVLGARGNLDADISQHDVLLHNPKLAVVNRHDRTMAAEMTASAARFGVSGHTAASVAQMDCGVSVQRQQP